MHGWLVLLLDQAPFQVQAFEYSLAPYGAISQSFQRKLLDVACYIILSMLPHPDHNFPIQVWWCATCAMGGDKGRSRQRRRLSDELISYDSTPLSELLPWKSQPPNSIATKETRQNPLVKLIEIGIPFVLTLFS